jgi:hypothetical protein
VLLCLPLGLLGSLRWRAPPTKLFGALGLFRWFVLFGLPTWRVWCVSWGALLGVFVGLVMVVWSFACLLWCCLPRRACGALRCFGCSWARAPRTELFGVLGLFVLHGLTFLCGWCVSWGVCVSHLVSNALCCFACPLGCLVRFGGVLLRPSCLVHLVCLGGLYCLGCQLGACGVFLGARFSGCLLG